MVTGLRWTSIHAGKLREMMPALVPELVEMASNPSVSTADLLRRALVVARRLAAPELIEWINSELTGYDGEVPEYRRLRGQLVVEHPYRGSIPFLVPADMDQLADFYVRQSISQLLHLQRTGNRPVSHFPPEIEQILVQMVQENWGVTLRPALTFSPVQLEGVIDTVRSRILDWALDLEGRGIIGEGMSFTHKEKQAMQEQHYHFGDISGSQIQIGTSASTQSQESHGGNGIEALRGLVEALSDVVDRGVFQGDAVDEIKAELATLRAQASSPRPKWEIIKATARSIKNVAEGAAGDILGELAKPHVQTLLTLAAGKVLG